MGSSTGRRSLLRRIVPLVGVVAAAAAVSLCAGAASAGSVNTTTMPPPSIAPSVSPVADAGRAGVGVAAAPAGWVNNVRVNRYRPSLARPQVEPSITSDARNRLLMVAGYSDSVDDVHPGVSRSSNGGVSWTAPRSGAILPSPPGYAWGPRSTAGRLAS